MDPVLASCLDTFSERFGALLLAHPYWLVNEHRVVGTFIGAALATQGFLDVPGALTPRDISTEAEHGRERKLDLVIRSPAVQVAIEFKGWNIVTKYRPEEERTEGVNLSQGYVDAQLNSVAEDVLELGRIATREPATVCLMVIYAQRPLAEEHARRFAGRKKAVSFSMAKGVESGAALSTWIKDNRQETPPIRIQDVPLSHPAARCAAGTEFDLKVYRVYAA